MVNRNFLGRENGAAGGDLGDRRATTGRKAKRGPVWRVVKRGTELNRRPLPLALQLVHSRFELGLRQSAASLSHTMPIASRPVLDLEALLLRKTRF